MNASRISSRLMISCAVAAMFPLAAAIAQDAPPPAESTQAPQQGATFESLDTNGDGKISKAEAAANEAVSSQFARYDQNGDGFIERSEVSAANSPPSEPKQ